MMMGIGTCSECGGRVTVPQNWMGTRPPVPSCEDCHATMARPHGAVIPMQRKAVTNRLPIAK